MGAQPERSGTPMSHAGIAHCTGSSEPLTVPDTSTSSPLAPVFSVKCSPCFSLCNDASEAHWEPGFISLKTLAPLRGICRWWRGEGGRLVIRMCYASCHILIQLRKRGPQKSIVSMIPNLKDCGHQSSRLWFSGDLGYPGWHVGRYTRYRWTLRSSLFNHIVSHSGSWLTFCPAQTSVYW